MKRGFTLVELAIVLVIIGLLIGGILAAQSMISTANIHKMVRQVNQFDIAVSNFKTKFNTLPGDSPYFDTAGDGDGLLENSDTNSSPSLYTDSKFDLEIANFWRHLSLQGFTPDNVIYTNDASSGIRAGVNVPNAAGKNKVSVMPRHAPLINKVYYYFCDTSNTTGPNGNTDTPKLSFAYTPQEDMAIEQKIDDGIPRIADMTTYTGMMYTADLTGQQCWDTSTYKFKTSVTTKQCCFLIVMLNGQEVLP